MTRLRFTRDPAEFLRLSRDHLATDPVRTTVIATNADRAARERAEALPEPTGRPWWFLTVHPDGPADGARTCGVAMRTAPFLPHPCWVQEMPEPAARGLAAALHRRGEFLGGVNGALPTARIVAEETARLWSARARVGEHTRLFELVQLRAPTGVPGRLRAADPADLDLVHAWRLAFPDAAATQGGRHTGGPAAIDLDDTRRRIRDRTVWLWEDGGRIVHLTGNQPPSLSVVRIGPVYTPPEHRGRGYAAAAVAAVSQLLLAGGSRVCLFTDQANPVSNALYRRIGFRAVVDMANFVIDR